MRFVFSFYGALRLRNRTNGSFWIGAYCMIQTIRVICRGIFTYTFTDTAGTILLAQKFRRDLCVKYESYCTQRLRKPARFSLTS